MTHSAAGFGGGGVGVCVFFVLSGYLITGILMSERTRTGSIHLGLFYARRALRLWPALIAMLGLTLLLGASVVAALIAGTYTTDLVLVLNHGGRTFPYGHTWSLAVEEQFYLLWPLLLPMAVRAPRRASVVLGVGVVASVLGCWVWTVQSVRTTGEVGAGVFNPLWQGHGLMIGCILALVGDRARVHRPGAVALGGGLLIVAAAVGASVTVNDHWAVWWNLAVELVSAALIIALRQLSTGLFTWRPLVWMGERSYAIYLWHLPLILLLNQHGLHGATLVAVASTFVLAELSARLVEAPFMRLKARMHPTATTKGSIAA